MKRGGATQATLALASIAVIALASVASKARAELATGLRVLDVPFVPQTPSLCGGAALAMVMRFWGEPGVHAEDFAALVNEEGDGIAAVDLETTLRARDWRAISFTGGLTEARLHLQRQRPIVALLRERGGANHYVVIVGASVDQVLLHDPGRGPFRVVEARAFEAAWRSGGGWGLLVLPPENDSTSSNVGDANQARPEAAPVARDDCALLVRQGVRLARAGELGAAEEILLAAHGLWPDMPAPLCELAGLRFNQKRWAEAEEFAKQAVRLQPGDAYVWELLGTTHFMRGDASAALIAWNQVQQPHIDLTRIDGLQRTRYDVVARLLDMPSGSLLTDGSLRRSRRRLDALPSRSSTHLSYRPLPNGMAQVQVNVHERPLWSAGTSTLPWVFVHTLVDRELRIASAAPTGNGELWSAGWRWSENRPAITAGVAMPGPAGIWRVDGLWERQAVRVDGVSGRQVVQLERRRAAIGLGQWATADLHWDVGTALERWTNRGRDIALEFGLEHRAANDRLAVRGVASRSWNTGGLAPYATGSLLAHWRSSSTADAQTLRLLCRAGIAVSSSNAPLLLWPGAGNAPGDAVLLRAHSRFEDGVLTGAGLGRELAHGGAEIQLWPWRTNLVRLGAATFADIAKARRSFSGDSAMLQADFGVGLRLRLASHPECLRFDVARSASDGQMAISLGFESNGSLRN